MAEKGGEGEKGLAAAQALLPDGPCARAVPLHTAASAAAGRRARMRAGGGGGGARGLGHVARGVRGAPAGRGGGGTPPRVGEVAAVGHLYADLPSPAEGTGDGGGRGGRWERGGRGVCAVGAARSEEGRRRASSVTSGKKPPSAGCGQRRAGADYHDHSRAPPMLTSAPLRGGGGGGGCSGATGRPGRGGGVGR